MELLKKYKLPLLFWIGFEAVALTLWGGLGNVFYWFNFTYIGSFIAAGFVLYIRRWRYARLFVQLGVGLYMLVYLGLMQQENMMLEGFWYYLFLGVFQAATIHYVVAKIAGPFLFGRGWCGYACWTPMLLDLLPYKVPEYPRHPRLGRLRYLLFGFSLLFVVALFWIKDGGLKAVMFWSFIGGNIVYYAVGVILAYRLKDNRAFCKYICPVAVLMKPAAYYALLWVKCDPEKCIRCGKCLKVCPMDVDMTDNARSRKNGTDCILCSSCVNSCPKKALKM